MPSWQLTILTLLIRNMNLDGKYKELIKVVISEAPFQPDTAVILGSGLGDFADKVNIVKSIYTKDLPAYPSSTVLGHKGIIHFAEYEGKKLLLYQGRIHLYEGYHISECVLPVFLSKRLGCKNVLLTNAAGGIKEGLTPGDLLLITSLLTFQIKKEITSLIGLGTIEERNRFLDFPSSYLNNIIRQSAIDEEIPLREGVYCYVKGPSYETPAEIQMIKKSGGDAVGMSTAHEAVFASYLGMETAAISCITNYASGISKNKLTHQEVTATANRSKLIFERLIKCIIRKINN